MTRTLSPTGIRIREALNQNPNMPVNEIVDLLNNSGVRVTYSQVYKVFSKRKATSKKASAGMQHNRKPGRPRQLQVLKQAVTAQPARAAVKPAVAVSLTPPAKFSPSLMLQCAEFIKACGSVSSAMEVTETCASLIAVTRTLS